MFSSKNFLVGTRICARDSDRRARITNENGRHEKSFDMSDYFEGKLWI